MEREGEKEWKKERWRGSGTGSQRVGEVEGGGYERDMRVEEKLKVMEREERRGRSAKSK